MSARDRHLKIEQYAEQNKQLRHAIGTVTMLYNEDEEIIALAKQQLEFISTCPTIDAAQNAARAGLEVMK